MYVSYAPIRVCAHMYACPDMWYVVGGYAHRVRRILDRGDRHPKCFKIFTMAVVDVDLFASDEQDDEHDETHPKACAKVLVRFAETTGFAQYRTPILLISLNPSALGVSQVQVPSALIISKSQKRPMV